MLDIAFSLLTPILVGFYIGYYLDSKFSKGSPIWTIILTILGVITGMWSIYKKYGK